MIDQLFGHSKRERGRNTRNAKKDPQQLFYALPLGTCIHLFTRPCRTDVEDARTLRVHGVLQKTKKKHTHTHTEKTNIFQSATRESRDPFIKCSREGKRRDRNELDARDIERERGPCRPNALPKFPTVFHPPRVLGWTNILSVS